VKNLNLVGNSPYFHSLAQVVSEATVSLAAPFASSYKLADSSLDVLLLVEFLWVGYPNRLYREFQSAYLWQYHNLSVLQMTLDGGLQLGEHQLHIALLGRAVALNLVGKVVKGHLARTNHVSKILAIIYAALDFVLLQSDT